MISAYKRAAMLTIAVIASGGYAGYMALLPWYSHSSGTLLNPATLSSSRVMASSSGPREAMVQIAGTPAPLFLLAAAVLIAGVGLVLRLGILPLLAIGPLWMARATASHSELLLLSGRYTNDFQLAGGAYESFLIGVWVTLGFTAALAGQLTYASHLERRESGEEDDGGMMSIPALSRFGGR